jgi:pyridinium-3,5-bisthiocarboxylic acid mononucleotide nickel chelatase
VITAYFDCFAGISGDMIAGAFLHAGMSFDYLEKELDKLNISGYKISKREVKKNSISGIKFDVKVTDDKSSRNLKDIIEIFENSDLLEIIKSRSISVFKRIAESESRIHNIDIDKIHFHEVSGIDSIIDVTAAIIGMEYFKIEKVYSSKIHIGEGFTESMHGTIPIPAPATIDLLKGIPVYSTGIKKELTTPTGAAIISSLADEFDNFPDMNIESSGYGAGTRDLKIPNLLRVLIGVTLNNELEEENIILIETNIDDMNPEFYDYIFSRLFEGGAIDIFLIPIIMKKSRPGNILNVLLHKSDMDLISEIIFSETTSSGLRIKEVKRKKLKREIIKVKTEYGDIDVKIHRLNSKKITISPEYESCKKIAIEKNLPLKVIYNAAVVTTGSIK